MKKLLIAVALIALAGGAMMMVIGTGTDWTTDSQEALREFESGLESRMKYYNSEAAKHFANAVELDPEFLAAKLYLSFHEEQWDRREALQAELREADLTRLTTREQFLVRFYIAQWDRDFDEARRLAEQYTKDNPGDAYGLHVLSELMWREQDFDEAERIYGEILEIDPNWAMAQNRLGYIALARGRFDEAEELFVTYNYIAPDQANPHDSMGELLVLVGRYEEAREQFERALELRPDFCNSHLHLIDLVLMQGNPEEAEPIIQRAAAHCGDRMASMMRCSVAIWKEFLEGEPENVWSDEQEDCRRMLGDYNFIVHRTACLTDRIRIAEKAERQLQRGIEAAEQAEHMRLDFPRALLLHMKGTRLSAQQEWEEAIELFQKADDMLLYWGEGQGILKLYNQVNLAYAQERAGLTDEAARTIARVEAVNPVFASHYPEEMGLF
jgi:tetratricopeptide (TPR) repeat protein